MTMFQSARDKLNEAGEEFLARDDRYVVDASRERFMLTMNPRGYLKRVR